MAVGLEWVAPAACLAAASAAITIALEDSFAGALPVGAIEIVVVLPPSSVVAAHHTAVEVYPLPLVDWNFAAVAVMTTRGRSGLGPCRAFKQRVSLLVTFDGDGGITRREQCITLVALYPNPLLGLGTDLGQLLSGFRNAVAPLNRPFAPHKIHKAPIGRAVALQRCAAQALLVIWPAPRP
jgi:hypothetical protein